ncbi:aminotransferase class I/II-fold pyridoxal phosphate-dependent enzyme [Kitasatospora hibisci]|uniref:aminotransferase class I/II-fold pyridoxal phosphate-dependent enzyme n=1 Tax=Kitasatospora hibisci TaxID=3369522 RepID=UPI00375523B5
MGQLRHPGPHGRRPAPERPHPARPGRRPRPRRPARGRHHRPRHRTQPRSVVVTLPDNPTGTIAHPDTLHRLAQAARDLDLVIVSDEIYCDLVYDTPAGPAVSPAAHAPERTVVTTGLTKNLAVGGWRTGIAHLPDSALGRALHTRLTAVASQLWSSTTAPVQDAAAYALTEPPEILAYVAAARRLHESVVRQAARHFTAAGAQVEPVRSTCYLYPSFEPLREHLHAAHGITGATQLATHFAQHHGVGLLPGTAFGDSDDLLRVRTATSQIYGTTEAEQNAALTTAAPSNCPGSRPPSTASPTSSPTSPATPSPTTTPPPRRPPPPPPPPPEPQPHPRNPLCPPPIPDPTAEVHAPCPSSSANTPTAAGATSASASPPPASPRPPPRRRRRPARRLLTDAGPQAVTALVDAAETLTVTAGDPDPALPPLLPTTAGGQALVSGFLGTHKAKSEAIVGYNDQPRAQVVLQGPRLLARMPGQPLVVPAEPVVIIEEAEMALVYVNDDQGVPHYAGYTFGNDLCDIGLHRIDPGYTASGKLCDTAFSPHLFLGEPRAATGRVTIERDGRPAWEGKFDCGADALWFRVDDLVDRAFSFPALRRPGLVNYVLTGADLSSFHDGFHLTDGDHIVIDIASHGVVLSNPLQFGGTTSSL